METHRLRPGICVGVLLLGCLAATKANAGDWPQILGPHRNGSAVDETIASAWPEGGLPVLWQREAGSGFAGVAVADGMAVLYHRVGDEQIVEGMNAATGEVLWKAAFESTYVPSYTHDDGPRAVPILHERRVYLYGALGNLRCLELKTGREVWWRDTYEDYNSKRYFRGEPSAGYFGLASSPIIEGDKILVNVGGDQSGAGIVAFSLKDGHTVWKATSERASYSSPVAVTVDGVRHVVFVTRLNVISIDPATGAIRFRFQFGQAGPTVNAATPVMIDRHLFVTASYGIGAAMARIDRGSGELLWQDEELLASQYTTSVEHEGHLFGIDGRQDGPPADLKCFDPKTRKTRWTERSFGYATFIEVGDKLLILKTDGELILAAANPQKYEPLAGATVSDTTCRALPALAGGRLYVRDSKSLKCFDLQPR
jgi:outer membrane protein assembly factor BamB